MAVDGNDSGADSDDDDYGWDLSLEEDVHQLLNTAAIPAAAAATSSSSITTTTSTTAAAHNTTPLRPVPVSDAVLSDPLRHETIVSPSQCAAAAVDTGVDPGDPFAALGWPGDVLDEAALAIDVDYPDLSQAQMQLASEPPNESTAPPADEAAASPLARFRTFPRKPLSVSDLTSGAWCELQYEYTLTRLPGGRRTRTPAMRAGTKVHARLEEEVHTTVRVDVASKEDLLGLKLWNMIQGLRTLRETGLTRELEIWGVVDARAEGARSSSSSSGHSGGEGGSDGMDEMGPQVVSGVIDALSYHNPDPAFEQQQQQQQKQQKQQKQKQKQCRGQASNGTASPPPPQSQSAQITDFFPSQNTPSSSPAPTESQPPPARKVYITDIKTRGVPRLPTGGAALRPTKIQLFLYHCFLSDLAAGRLDFFLVFRRYGLDADASFSDAFLAQIGGMHDEVFSDNDEDQVRYGTLRALLGLLQAEVALTFPYGADSIGSLVAVEYRLRPPPRVRRGNGDDGKIGNGEEDEEADEDEDEGEDGNDGGDDDTGEHDRCIGTIVLPVDAAALDGYLQRYLEWWRGMRPAVGVTIEEAGFKCGHCEFAAACDWRRELDEERVRRVRAKMAGQKRSPQGI
ncbi:Defects-in-morphology protein 1-like, mitochondrial [Niveomyces insectorum RCEF 264]|uniref:Defects-in-morphology protein 1-like, mitochondrial n=1 Tax=Niveomyces insectorum RCEF 264 TaxID=1081102 RepID=A0A162MT62_9HYPO|nr:Defects-in-morphology protein 1-like, mitochondrial [Niveomyces insectorum RCEF 264]